MKKLAVVPTKETVLGLLKLSLANRQVFEYRLEEGARRNFMVDRTSVNMIVQVAEALTPDNRERFLEMAPNVGRMAVVAWRATR